MNSKNVNFTHKKAPANCKCFSFDGGATQI